MPTLLWRCALRADNLQAECSFTEAKLASLHALFQKERNVSVDLEVFKHHMARLFTGKVLPFCRKAQVRKPPNRRVWQWVTYPLAHTAVPVMSLKA